MIVCICVLFGFVFVCLLMLMLEIVFPFVRCCQQSMFVCVVVCVDVGDCMSVCEIVFVFVCVVCV